MKVSRYAFRFSTGSRHSWNCPGDKVDEEQTTVQ